MLFFFFFNDTATTEIYTLSLHDALPIYSKHPGLKGRLVTDEGTLHRFVNVYVNDEDVRFTGALDRKSTRLNSSHANISYAVFCLKKKKKNKHIYNVK